MARFPLIPPQRTAALLLGATVATPGFASTAAHANSGDSSQPIKVVVVNPNGVLTNADGQILVTDPGSDDPPRPITRDDVLRAGLTDKQREMVNQHDQYDKRLAQCNNSLFTKKVNPRPPLKLDKLVELYLDAGAEPTAPYDKSPSNLHFHVEIVGKESHGCPDAANPQSDAAGLAQFLGSTAKEQGVNDPYDPKQAAEGMVRYAKERDKLGINVWGKDGPWQVTHPGYIGTNAWLGEIGRKAVNTYLEQAALNHSGGVHVGGERDRTPSPSPSSTATGTDGPEGTTPSNPYANLPVDVKFLKSIMKETTTEKSNGDIQTVTQVCNHYLVPYGFTEFERLPVPDRAPDLTIPPSSSSTTSSPTTGSASSSSTSPPTSSATPTEPAIVAAITQ